MNKHPRYPLVVALSACALLAHAGEVEVLHWWTSGGEANSVKALQQMLEQQGHHWKDFAIPGGGGESAMTVLKTRTVSGNPPAAAQIKGLDIQEWARLGFLANLDDVAREDNWDAIIPEVIRQVVQYQGHYVAVPVNVHRVNWLWVNVHAFELAGATIPHTLEQFFLAADQLKAAGIIPLAHGGQPWQDATLFEAIALSVLGPELYHRAFVDHEPDILRSQRMVDSFRAFRKMKQYIGDDGQRLEWNAATDMVISGQAAMQVMGDWAKGEFTAAGKRPGEDYICTAFPGTDGEFTFNIDSFAMFKLQQPEQIKAQKALARTIVTPAFQEVFNLNKGSIPVRTDMSMGQFDLCSRDSMATFISSAREGKLVPSFAHGMATTGYVQGAIFDVVSQFFRNDAETPEQAAIRLARAIKAAS